jgi:glycosyltransferase involved in cell wall biosynthesis
MDVSIIIPAYNEERNLAKNVLDSVYDYLRKQKYTWEVLIVDDGSTDRTAEICENFSKKHHGFRVLREPHRGKGGTVIAGMLATKGEIVLFTDMDQATPIYEIEKLLHEFKKGYDIVIGSRSGRKGANTIRKVMAYGFMTLRTIILRLPFKDTQCGFKAFKKQTIKPIFERIKVFKEHAVEGSAVTAGFDLEILYIARKLGYKIQEVVVEWEEKGDRGNYGVNPIKDSIDGLKDLLHVRMNALSGKYNI